MPGLQTGLGSHRGTQLQGWEAVRTGAVTLALLTVWLVSWSWGPAPWVLQTGFSLVAGVFWWLAFGSFTLVAWAWLLAALVSAWMGLNQYLGLAPAFAGVVSAGDVGQAMANLRQRNQLATLLNMGLLALLWCWQTKLFTARPWTHHVTLGVSAALLGAAMEASGSRTGLLQLVFVGCMTWTNRMVDKEGFTRWLFGAAVAGYVAAILLLPSLIGVEVTDTGILGRVHEATGTGTDCQSRMVLWRNVLHLIAQQPWAGWGWGELDYAHFVTLYPGPRFCAILDNAHNLPLQLAVELGLPAALFLCTAAVGLCIRAKPWAETEPSRQLAWMVLAVIGIHSLLEYPLWYGPFQLAAVACILQLLGGCREDSQKGRRPHLATYVLAFLVLMLNAAIVWDYLRVSQIFRPPAQRWASYRDDTLEKIKEVHWFRDQAQFAELTITPLTHANAQRQYDLAVKLLHFSPEPRVVERLIESATLLGRRDSVEFYLLRFQAAFPQEYGLWVQVNGLPLTSPPAH